MTFEGLSEEQSEAVTDSLLHADAWTGGAPGVAPEAVTDLMAIIGLLGRRGGLTKRGAALAKQAQVEHWGAVQ